MAALSRPIAGCDPNFTQYARIIQKLGFEAQFQDFKIQNVVASCDVKFPIRLEGLAFSHGLFCSVSVAAGGPAAPPPPGGADQRSGAAQ